MRLTFSLMLLTYQRYKRGWQIQPQETMRAAITETLARPKSMKVVMFVLQFRVAHAALDMHSMGRMLKESRYVLA